MNQPLTIDLLASVVSGYQFVLVDNNILNGPIIGDNGLFDCLYDIHTLAGLRRQQPIFEDYIRYWKQFSDHIAAQSHVYTTDAILSEAAVLHRCITQSTSFHQKLLNNRIYRASIGNYLRHLKANRRGKRLVNQFIERTRSETRETSPEETYLDHAAPVVTLATTANTLHALLSRFKTYNGQRHYQTTLPINASPNDLTLVDALCTYLLDPQHKNDYGTIITADADIFKILYHILGHVEKRQNILPLTERASVSYYNAYTGVIETKEYNPYYRLNKQQSIRTDMH